MKSRKKQLSIILTLSLFAGILSPMSDVICGSVPAFAEEQDDSQMPVSPEVTADPENPDVTPDPENPDVTPTPAPTHQAKYTKKVSYKKIRKKLRGQKTLKFSFSDVNKKSSKLTFFGFFFDVWKIPHVGYGDTNETITMYPTITAKKKGSKSTLSFGIKLRSIVKVISKTKRKFKKMTISGGGEKITISGKTSTRTKRVGEFVKYQVFTTGTFTLSKNTKANISKLEKLDRIMSSNNPMVKIKDSVKGKTYKCDLEKYGSKSMKSFIKKYLKVLKNYKK